MKPTNRYVNDILDMDAPQAAGDVLFRPGKPTSAVERSGAVVLTVPFRPAEPGPAATKAEPEGRTHEVLIRAYGEGVVRVSAAFAGELPGDEGPMLEWHESLKPMPLHVRQTPSGWDIADDDGAVRMRIDTTDPPVKQWSALLETSGESFFATVFPDGETPVEFMAYDEFGPQCIDSLPLGFVERAGRPHRAAFSLHAAPGECFAGTGERFSDLNLAGRTLVLENTDGLGVNSRRTYKNVPLFVSSRPYGLLIHTPEFVRLSLAGVSTRAACAAVSEPAVDLFFLGGGSLERILYNYRRVTGFPRNVPLWSYGTWMSRMTYFSAEECREVGRKLREGGFPCDVLHIDTGWFEEDWKCTWTFGDRFPDPEKFLTEMRERGFRVSLWQMPKIGEDNRLFDELNAKGYLGALRADAKATGSDFATTGRVGHIDFTNPAATRWYQDQLERLLAMGTAVIKTDFGEDINMDAEYAAMPATRLRNLYGLLYQKAAWEITERVTGEPLIWARAGWAGCQRYPVHWGGDCACTWDGLAGSLRGGLHLGLSGFAFWSHDVPGFHGVPDFMNSWPDDELYVRWTQVGVFTSHLRYHGTSPREPYEYPAVAEIARKWLKLRYALIPYLADEGAKAAQTGMPLLRAMVFGHESDRTCWHISDQFFCGEALLVAPVLNAEGVRDVYLPEGDWVDFWTGETVSGPRWLKDVQTPLERLPVFARRGATIRVYPDAVQHTGEMDLGRCAAVTFDDAYEGIGATVVGKVTGL